MVIDYLFGVVHAAVTDLDGVSVEDYNHNMMVMVFRLKIITITNAS